MVDPLVDLLVSNQGIVEAISALLGGLFVVATTSVLRGIIDSKHHSSESSFWINAEDGFSSFI